jgi:hypothetical protein
MIWYSVRPKVPVDPPTRLEALKKENEDLRSQVASLQDELKDIRERLEVWRRFFDLPMPCTPGSAQAVKMLLPTTPEVLKQHIFEAEGASPSVRMTIS